MEIEVKGHSGCKIEIVSEANDLYIYKSSYDKKYLPRLVKQAIKQQQAAKDEYQHVRIPQIFELVHDEEHVSIKMEYVYSRNFIEYFETAGFEQIDYFIKALVLFVEKELKDSVLQKVPVNITINKFYDVKKVINSNNLLRGDDEILHLMELANAKMETFAKNRFIEIPVGRCHGDLTFSNILFNGNNYYLIDFLDSFIESPLMDIVKIRQDSYHLWSQLMYVKPYDQLRLKIVSEKIDKEIQKYFSRYEWYAKFYDIFQLLNMLRILQYAKEEKVVVFLKREIKNLLNNSSNEIKKTEDNFNYIKSNNFSLIIPAAADNEEQNDVMPYLFNLDSSGIMLCIRSIQGLNLKAFDNIYFSVLNKHSDLYCLESLFKIQFDRLGLKNAKLVILDEPTCSQPETVYQTIVKEGIAGSIFIKDADGYFSCEVNNENGIAIFPLEDLDWINPQHKSYVSVDDFYYVTNIIEKKIISHYFNAGGYCFKDVRDFCSYFLKYHNQTQRLYMSHIIYAMLLDRKLFRPHIVNQYKDWGDKKSFSFLSL